MSNFIQPLELVRAQGSVLYSVSLGRQASVPAGRQEVRVPVEVVPSGRCDEHAIGQATGPYSFKYEVRLGDAQRILVLTPPVALQERIARMLLDHCRRAGGVVINR